MREIRIADYIIEVLEECGVEHIFMITGGGAMFLNDAVGKSKRIKYICCHHEQALAIAAEGYARCKNALAVVVVTSGPGGTNALTGVGGQWLDSIPTLYLSGQVKFETTIHSDPKLGLRQLGDQEIDIISIVSPITKYAALVTDPLQVDVELRRAIAIALSGRQGPVWLDIPLNVQGATVKHAAIHRQKHYQYPGKTDLTAAEKGQFRQMLESSVRPVVAAGHGIRLSQAVSEFLAFVERESLPVVTTFNGFDVIPGDHPLFVGRIGTVGTRSGNFALQNADLIISVGTRNNIRQVSYNWGYTGRCARKIVVDIDEAELRKKTYQPDLGIVADVRSFLSGVMSMDYDKKVRSTDWLGWCQQRQLKYGSYTKIIEQKEKINPYHLIEAFTGGLREGDIVVAGNGTACVALFQAGIVKSGQRIFWNSGMASMGYDIPAAIGAAFASGKQVYCIAGDGSVMMNLQELQTIAAYQLPVKILLLNNDGYISIRQTQNSFFAGHLVGTGPETGVKLPDFTSVAKAFSIPAAKIESPADMRSGIDSFIAHKGPILCEVLLDADYQFTPKLSSEKRADGTMISKPLEDMYPFMDRKEFLGNMIVPVVES